MLEPAAGGRAWRALGAAALLIAAALLVRRAAAAAARRIAVVVAVAVAGLALALLAGGARRRAPAARGLGRAGRRWSGAASPRCPAPASRTAGSTRTCARRSRSAARVLVAARGAARVLAARRGRGGFPVAGAARARDALRGPGRRADPAARSSCAGALLMLLVVAFLRARAPAPPRRRRPAASLAAAVAVLALLVAPALDSEQPWWDYESWSQIGGRRRSRRASAGTTTTAPLDWPRDGRELLRISSRQPRLLEGRQPRRLRRASAGCAGRASPSHESTGFLFDGIELSRIKRWSFDDQGHACATCARRRCPSPAAPTRVFMPRQSTSSCAPGRLPAARPIRRGDAYSAEVYVPQPIRSRPAHRRHDVLRAATCAPTRRSTCDARRTGRRAGAAGRPHDAVVVAGFAARADASSRRRRIRAEAAARALRPARAPTRSRRSCCAAPTPVRVPARDRALARRRLLLLRARRPRVAHARRLPVRQPDRLLPAVLGRDGAAAAAWAASRRASRPASRRAPSTARPRSTSCATSTRTPGSRRGSPASAGSPSTRRRPAPRRARRRPATRRAPASATCATSGRRRLTRAGRCIGPGDDGPPWARPGCSAAWPPRALLGRVRAGDPARAAASAAGVRARARAARARAGASPPGATLRALETRFAGHPPTRPGTCGAARPALRGAGAGGPTPAQRRGLRRALGRGRGPLEPGYGTWSALPPRLPAHCAPAPTLTYTGSDGLRLRPLHARHAPARGR